MRTTLRLVAVFLAFLGATSLAVWWSNSGGYGESPVALIAGVFLLGLGVLLWVLKRD